MVGKLLFFWLPVEWVAVLFGAAMTVAAVALAIASAARAYRTWRLLPIGALVYVVLPAYTAKEATTSNWLQGWGYP
jgi:hypothetical protein